jgi:hypothetical protein
MTIQNVLTLALLLVVMVPSYFAYQFLSDESFRAEFMRSARILDVAGVPCLVLVTAAAGTERYTVVLPYAIRARTEHIVGQRSPGPMTDAQVTEACKTVQEDSLLVLGAVRARDAAKEGK